MVAFGLARVVGGAAVWMELNLGAQLLSRSFNRRLTIRMLSLKHSKQAPPPFSNVVGCCASLSKFMAAAVKAASFVLRARSGDAPWSELCRRNRRPGLMPRNCRVARVESASGGSPVDVVVTTEDRPRHHVPAELVAAWRGSLQTERSTRAMLVVVADELGRHRPDIALVCGC